jgi:hypothetical protein
MTGMIDVPAGTELLETPSKDGLRICQSFNSPSMFTTIKPCFVDDNKDGQFDKWSFNPNGKLISLKTTIPYSKHLNETAYRDAFTKVVVYQGATPSTLSLSYREFSGGIARPAFTEDLSIPLSANFPQEVRFKNVRIEIDAISGIGLTYTLLPSS